MGEERTSPASQVRRSARGGKRTLPRRGAGAIRAVTKASNKETPAQYTGCADRQICQGGDGRTEQKDFQGQPPTDGEGKRQRERGLKRASAKPSEQVERGRRQRNDDPEEVTVPEKRDKQDSRRGNYDQRKAKADKK